MLNRVVIFHRIQFYFLLLFSFLVSLSKGKGAIILPAHYGNWKIMANAVGYFNLQAHYVAKRLDNPYIDRAVNDYRCETGNQVIYELHLEIPCQF